MKLACFLLSFLFAAITISAQVNPQCPSVSIEGPPGLPAPDGQISFTVSVVPTETKLAYKWTLSSGTIVSGQGTPTIEVRVEPNEGIPTVSVEVGGLQVECPNAASESSIYDPPPQAKKLDTFSLPLSSVSENRFQRIAGAVENNPTLQIYIFVPTDKAVREEFVARLDKIIRKGIDPMRITIIELNGESEIIEVWLVPPGASPPTKCEACKSAENVKQECPRLFVSGPAGITSPGDMMTFIATVETGETSSLKYKWTLENGTIDSGQGTRKVVVRFQPKEEWQPKVVATVEVIGLPARCANTASDIYTYVIDPSPLELDGFSQPAEISGKRLHKIADAANKQGNAQIYIFVPPDKAVRDLIASRLNKLITVQNEDGGRLTFVWNKRKNSRIEIWLILPGVTPPVNCRSCEVP